MKKFIYIVFFASIITSCKKNSDQTTPTNNSNDPKVGSKWSFKVTNYDESGVSTGTTTVNFTGIALNNAGSVWIALKDDASNVSITAIQKRSDGWWYLPSPATNTNSSLWFKTPAAVNDTYPYVYGTCKVLSTTQSVTVPAGMYDNCTFVQGDDTNSKEDEFWFKDNGPVIVRFDTYDQRTGGPASNVYRKQSTELVSYTP